ncbi:shikimate / quinate 5-dehydrogenase protein [Penicillium pulvis]|uniref:shikimate / quinate 5-dehydrogenase protein n=1 Tax=Penicillium pulvis TaxID=1562058 RepID=UPI002546AD57|nr:shikimate / quinate 5-dehydrogenase protein [Penicillium pulvis]KAJ5784407.1 shikimate / quinate 5-dehydrogenase protein [Penicillium pulvis]
MPQQCTPVDISSPTYFHIFGSEISFSISPTIHNAGFKHYDLPFTYDIRESPSIDEVAGLILNKQFGGGSVTMPHKLHVHKYCTEQTDTARLIGAINTLVIKGSGENRAIIGDNTDWSGLHTIIANYSTKTRQQPNVGLVIGAGGASRAALYSMHRAGIRHIYIINRTVSVSEKVKKDFASTVNVTILPNLQNLPRMPDVIIGTVPAHVTIEDQFASIFGPRGLCIEMSYKPRQTPLLNVAQRHEGWEIVTGVEVLLSQAYDQFQLWTGREPPKEKMVEAVAEHEREQARKEKNAMR